MTEAALARRRAPLDAALFDLIAAAAPRDVGEREDILSMLIASTDMDDRTLRDELLTLLVPGTRRPRPRWPGRSSASPATRGVGAAARGDEDYLDAVVKETLRLRPVVPAVLRMLKAPVSIAGYDLPAGVAVLPNILLVHTRADVYPDPFAFRSERFLEPPRARTRGSRSAAACALPGASFAIFEMKAVLRAVAARSSGSSGRCSEHLAAARLTLVPRPGAAVSVARRTAPAPRAQPVRSGR